MQSANRLPLASRLERGGRTSGLAARLPGPAETPRVHATPSLRVQSDRILTGATARAYWGVVAVWVATNALFWAWWLQPERVQTPWLFVLLSFALAYEGSVVPSFYLFLVGRMRQPRHFKAQANLKVALITPCVPANESLDVIVRQLEALSNVTYPHDSWVLDEGNDPAVRAAAERFGARYFSRQGIKRYNQPDWPLKAKTKAGNINAWLDAHGQDYEFFVQLDIDHVPVPEYLDRVLGYFRDPGVAWVQAPSLYGNLDNWVARGAAEQDRMWQDPIQKGFFGTCETPLIINSHCSYRMSAVLEIGGFQQTRSEDHLNMVVLSARGHRGVYVPERLAVGLGPETLETYLQQQFAWAEAMSQILIHYTPRFFRRLRPLQGILLLYNQTWYPLSSLSKLILFAVPLFALAFGQQPAQAPLAYYALASIPLVLSGLLIPMWTRRWQQPSELDFTWRGVVLTLARWPMTLWAFVTVLLGIKHPYQITAKGESDALPRLSVRTNAVYLTGTWITLLVILQYLSRDPWDEVQGQVLWACLGLVFLLVVAAVHLLADVHALRQRGVAALELIRLRGRPLLMLGATLTMSVATLAATHDLLAQTVLWTGAADTHVAAAADSAPWRDILLNSASDAAVTDAAVSIAETLPTQVNAPEDSSVSEFAKVEPELAEVSERLRPAILPLELPDAQISFGAYDPWQRLSTLPLSIEHWYVHEDDPEMLAGALAHARNERTPMITLEPWPAPGQRTPVLDRVVAGRSDDDLRRLARVIRERSPQVVLLRWGHEMDLSGLYPWSANDPQLYRAAFRHVVTIFRMEGVDNVRWVWSPAGEPGAVRFYPGDDVVDYVGLTVLGDADWDRGFGLERQSFSQLLQPRYAEIQALGKPVVIAELGVSGGDPDQRTWLADGMRDLQAFPLLRAIVYFDDRNAPNNRLLTEPDWRVEADVLGSVIPALPAAEPGLQGPALDIEHA